MPGAGNCRSGETDENILRKYFTQSKNKLAC